MSELIEDKRKLNIKISDAIEEFEKNHPDMYVRYIDLTRIGRVKDPYMIAMVETTVEVK